ncbi:TetR/AcrR family transcriptional regulator [Nocardia alba]|uniref:TetR family transcriptional regulator n=1 Tax=Nocardia alba TaxID=225051 RepID=A0A4R1FWY2_9NOCA|nr:TetR/AcrR family transcriptional regulator [Nocardia alba]TCK00057.1 TetR family transcriptional regulator [Nocardia alba]
MSEAENPGGGVGDGVLAEQRAIDAALAVLDSDGARALSVGAVARRLGVAPDAVRTRFGGADGLERAVIESVLSTVALGPLTDDGVEWTAAVIQFALGMRGRLFEHPAVAELIMAGPMDSPSADGPVARAMTESLFVCLARGGLPAPIRARGVYAVLVHVFGSIALDVAETDGRPPLPGESERIAARRAALSELDPTRWPRTVAHLTEIAAWTSVDQFVWGLRVLLVGMTAT